MQTAKTCKYFSAGSLQVLPMAIMRCCTWLAACRWAFRCQRVLQLAFKRFAATSWLTPIGWPVALDSTIYWHFWMYNLPSPHPGKAIRMAHPCNMTMRLFQGWRLRTNNCKIHFSRWGKQETRVGSMITPIIFSITIVIAITIKIFLL